MVYTTVQRIINSYNDYALECENVSIRIGKNGKNTWKVIDSPKHRCKMKLIGSNEWKVIDDDECFLYAQNVDNWILELQTHKNLKDEEGGDYDEIEWTTL